MRSFRLTLQLASGDVQTAELVEGQYSVGASAEDQIQLTGEGIGAGHVRLVLAGEKLQVEPVFAGVNVNGYAIEALVEVELPASVELPGVTLVLEALAESTDPQAAALAPTIQMPRQTKPSKTPVGNLDVTLPMPPGGPRTPPSRGGRSTAGSARSSKQEETAIESANATNKTPLTAE